MSINMNIPLGKSGEETFEILPSRIGPKKFVLYCEGVMAFCDLRRAEILSDHLLNSLLEFALKDNELLFSAEEICTAFLMNVSSAIHVADKAGVTNTLLQMGAVSMEKNNEMPPPQNN